MAHVEGFIALRGGGVHDDVRCFIAVVNVGVAFRFSRKRGRASWLRKGAAARRRVARRRNSLFIGYFDVNVVASV
jgi:hypothetical protein